VVAKLPIDESETELLTALLERLADDPGLRRALGREARRHVAAAHELEAAAWRYAGALRRLAAAPVPPLAVPPLAPGSGADPRLALAASVGAALVDLGRDDTDLAALGDLASTLAQLGWAPRAASPP
jgi:hypothetical protein